MKPTRQITNLLVNVFGILKKRAILAHMREGSPEGNPRLTDTEWMRDAKCRDMPPNFFFPNDGVGVEAAKKICAECVVREECLDYALANKIEHGVWGGTSERERRRMSRRPRK